MIRDSGVLPSELHRGKKCGCWLLVSRTKCGCCSSQKKKLSRSSPKKPRFSKPSDKTSRTSGSSATMFLVDMICTQAPAHCHLKIPIKWYGSIYFVSLVEKSVVSFVQKKLPKIDQNSIQIYGKRSCFHGRGGFAINFLSHLWHDGIAMMDQSHMMVQDDSYCQLSHCWVSGLMDFLPT